MACTSRRRVTVLVSRVTSCFSIPCSFTSTIRSRTHTRSYHFGSQQLVRQHYDSHTVLATRAYPGYCSSHSCKCRSKLVSSLTSFDCNSNRKFKSSCKSTCNYNFTRRISSSTTTRAHEEVWAGMNSSTRELAKGLLECKRSALAKSITLIESTRLDHQHQSELLMEYLADRTMDQKKLRMGTSFRIGVAGPPGAGKSTFIEAIGKKLLEKSHRIAVIPVDPSSHISGGSILGDKTRMEQLTRSPNCYIRASPTSGMLGGIAEHTNEIITLCEIAGYNIVMVESVGLGQSEVDIDGAVDMLVLLVPPGGGDGLQASKKGIVEAADLLVVNKADGTLLQNAQHTKADYAGALQFVRQKHHSWRPKVMLCSAYTDFNVDEVLKKILEYQETMVQNGYLHKKRAVQAKKWMVGHVNRKILNYFSRNQDVKQSITLNEQLIEDSRITPIAAASKIFRVVKSFLGNTHQN